MNFHAKIQKFCIITWILILLKKAKKWLARFARIFLLLCTGISMPCEKRKFIEPPILKEKATLFQTELNDWSSRNLSYLCLSNAAEVTCSTCALKYDTTIFIRCYFFISASVISTVIYFFEHINWWLWPLILKAFFFFLVFR